MAGPEQHESVEKPSAASQKAKAAEGFAELEGTKAEELSESNEKAPSEFEYTPGQSSEATSKTVKYLKTTPKFKDDDPSQYRKYFKDAISELWQKQKDAIGRGKGKSKVESDTVVDFGDKKVKFVMTSAVQEHEHKLKVSV